MLKEDQDAPVLPQTPVREPKAQQTLHHQPRRYSLWGQAGAGRRDRSQAELTKPMGLATGVGEEERVMRGRMMSTN